MADASAEAKDGGANHHPRKDKLDTGTNQERLYPNPHGAQR